MELYDNKSNEIAAGRKIDHYGKSAQLMRRRAKSSMPTRQFDQQFIKNDLNETSLRDFKVETTAYRPGTSNAFRVPFNLSDPIGVTHYDETFEAKPIVKQDCIRAATSSGARCNKPHPNKEFMVFRFKPMNPITNPLSDWSQPIGDKLIKQVIKNQMKSIYATDYVNNVEEKRAFEERSRRSLRPSMIKYNEWKDQRALEQKRLEEPMPVANPFTYESLFISPSRYGSSVIHKKPAYGIVPNCSKFWYEMGVAN